MRRVEIYDVDYEGDLESGEYPKKKIGEGWFHSFSTEFGWHPGGEGNSWTAAIVEREDGSVKAIGVDFIRFINTPDQTNQTTAKGEG